MHKARYIWRLLCKGLYIKAALPLFKPAVFLLGLFATIYVLTGFQSPWKQSDIESPLQLDLYRAQANATVLADVQGNASGLSYNVATDTLFAVINNPEYLLELRKDGSVIRKINLIGFHDTEAVVALDHNRFAILEERRRTLVLASIDQNTREIHRDHQQLISLSFMANAENKGFEGIAFDSQKQRLYVVNEKEPKQLLSIDGAAIHPNKNAANASIVISSPWQDKNLQQAFLTSNDYSGLHFEHNSNHLLMLSDESKELIEIDTLGNPLSRLDLSWFNKDLPDSIPQPEGVTMDANGDIYILSEPNLLYRFSRPSTDVKHAKL